MSSRFAAILHELGIDNPYEPIDYDDLEPEQQDRIDALNLRGILEEQVSAGPELDVLITRFVLRRLAQLDDTESVSLILENFESLYPVFKDALEYLQTVRSLESEHRHQIGRELLALLEGSIVAHLEYHRCWILNTFTKNREWDNEDEFVTLYERHPDHFAHREVILAMGRAHVQHWFKTRKRSLFDFSPWERRAFLAAASCLPGDEAKHWYGSLLPRFDELDKAIVTWAKAHPF